MACYSPVRTQAREGNRNSKCINREVLNMNRVPGDFSQEEKTGECSQPKLSTSLARIAPLSKPDFK
jgi:hypothetical protein